MTSAQVLAASKPYGVALSFALGEWPCDGLMNSSIAMSQTAAVAAALERGFGIDPSPKLVAALKDAMRDCGSFTLVAAGRLESIARRSARARRAAIPVQGPPPPVDGAEARDDGAAFAAPINRWGGTRLFTLEDLDKTTDVTGS